MAYGVGGWSRPRSQVGEHDTGTWHPATRPSHASLGIDDAQAASLLVVLKSISADLAYTSGDLSSDEGFGRLEGPKCFKYSSTSVQP